MDNILSNLFSLVLTILVIALLVFVHELGHFLAAKFFKMEVKEFAIGFGKQIWKKKYKGTTYALRALPLGGFVDLEGETKSDSPDGFRNRPAYQKVIVLLAGVTMNFILAVITLGIYLGTQNYTFSLPAITDFNFTNTESVVKAYPLQVNTILEDSPAESVLEQGEWVVGINGEDIKDFQGFKDVLDLNQNQSIVLNLMNINDFSRYEKIVQLGGKDENGSILRVSFIEINQALMGYQGYYIKYNSNITSAFSITYDISRFLPQVLAQLIGDAFKSRDFSELGQSVGSPIQILEQSGQIVDSGAYFALVPMIGLLSISLAVFNVLPLPALDGGQIVIVLIERIRRKKISDNIVERVNLIGFVALMTLSVLIIFKDVIQLNIVSRIISFVQNLF
jgi:regulator of sigma E protease